MLLLRAYLGLFLIILLSYTANVIANHGFGLFAIFFGDIARMGWPGQFNLDFMGFLILSGAWTAWRHHFSPVGLLLGLVAVVGGMGFLTIYLLAESFRAKGDVRVLLLGARRATAPVAA